MKRHRHACGLKTHVLPTTRVLVASYTILAGVNVKYGTVHAQSWALRYDAPLHEAALSTRLSRHSRGQTLRISELKDAKATADSTAWIVGRIGSSAGWCTEYLDAKPRTYSSADDPFIVLGKKEF